MAEGLDVQVAMLKTLECPVCLTMYNPGERQAQVLHCGHTFCKMCVDSMLISSSVVKCPKCRVHTESSDVRANFTVNEMFDALCGDCLHKPNSEKCCHCDKLLCSECLAKHSDTLREETEQQIRQCKENVAALQIKIEDTGCIEDEMKNAQITLEALREHVKSEKNKLEKFETTIEEQILALNVGNIDFHDDWKKQLEFMHKDAKALAERSSDISQDMDQQSILTIKQKYMSYNHDISTLLHTSPTVKRYAFVPNKPVDNVWGYVIPDVTPIVHHGLPSTPNPGKLPLIQQFPDLAGISKLPTSPPSNGAIPKSVSSYGRPFQVPVAPYQQFVQTQFLHQPRMQFCQPVPMQSQHGYNGSLLGQPMFKFPAKQTTENIIKYTGVKEADAIALNVEANVQQWPHVNPTSSPHRNNLHNVDRLEGVSYGELNDELSVAELITDVNEQVADIGESTPEEQVTDTVVHMASVIGDIEEQSSSAHLGTEPLGAVCQGSDSRIAAPSKQPTAAGKSGISSDARQIDHSTNSVGSSVGSPSVKFPLCMQLICPRDVAVSNNGDIYVSGDDKIIVFDSHYNRKCDFEVPHPTGIYLNNNGVLVCGDDSVQLFSSEMKLMKTLGHDIDWQQCPRSVAQLCDGHIYACDEKDIKSFTEDGKYKISHKHTAYNRKKGHKKRLKFLEPIYISPAKECTLFVCYENSIAIFNEDKGFTDFPLSTPSNLGPIRPRGIATDSIGRIAIADYNGRVVIFSPTGKYLGSIGARGSGIGQLEKPNGIVIDNNGRIIVCDTGNNRIQIFEMPSNLQK